MPANEHVVACGTLEAHPCKRRTLDAAKPVLTTREVGPTEGNGVEHRRKRQRQKREIDAAAAQNKEAEAERDDCHRHETGDERQQHLPREQVQLRKSRTVGCEAEPRAVTERCEACMPHKNVERHAGDAEHHNLRGGGDAEPHACQQKRQNDEAASGDDEIT